MNRYSLEGRDPRSCTGSPGHWAGTTAHFAAPVFGTVRAIVSTIVRRKLRMQGFWRRYAERAVT